MAEQTIALTEQLKKLSEEFESVNDQIKEMLDLFGQVSQSGAAAMRSMASQSRAADQALRSLSSTMKSMTGTSSVIGAANTSAALGALTGGGGAGGGVGGGAGGGGGTGGPANNMLMGAILNPLSQGLPQIAGITGRGLGNLGRAVIGRIPFLGGPLSRATAHIPELMGAAASMGTSAVISAGQQLVGDATNLRLGMEESGFYMRNQQRGRLEGFSGRALDLGVTPTQLMGLGSAANLAVGVGTQALPQMFAEAGSRGALRIDPSSFMPLASTLAAGNAEVVGTMSRVLGFLNREGFVGREGTSRDSQNILGSIESLIGMQVGATGRLRGGGIPGASAAANVAAGLSRPFGGPFDTSQAGRMAQALVSTAMAPGGGEGGQIAMLQAFGFGNPNMDALNRMDKAFGGQGNFQRTSYITARMMQERALEEGGIERLLAFVRTAAGGNVQQQAMLLSNISGGRIGINQGVDILSAPGLSEQMREKIAEQFKLRRDQQGQALEGLPLTAEQLKLIGVQLGIPKKDLVEIVSATRDLTAAIGPLVAEALPGLIKAFKAFVNPTVAVLEAATVSVQRMAATLKRAGVYTVPKKGP